MNLVITFFLFDNKSSKIEMGKTYNIALSHITSPSDFFIKIKSSESASNGT
jgi:hypothetical protein